jgi:hypothetical protein
MILDEVPTHSEADTMNFRFVWMDVNNKYISENLAFWYYMAQDEENCVGSFNAPPPPTPWARC